MILLSVCRKAISLTKNAIGSKIDFFDYIAQSMYDWHDYTAHCLRQLGNNLIAVQQSLKPFSIVSGYEMRCRRCCLITAHLKDLSDRNPKKDFTANLETRLAFIFHLYWLIPTKYNQVSLVSYRS